jgi:hypothetical protein
MKHGIKTDTRSEYKKIESATFDALSLWIRKSYDIGGYVKCYTCGSVKPCKGGIHGIHAGHYVSRKSWKTMFHLDNIRPQCYDCNVHLGGNRKEFEKRLNLEKGYDIAGELLRLSNTIDASKRSIEVLKAMGKQFRKYPKEYTWVIGGVIYPNIAEFERFRLVKEVYKKISPSL